MQAFLTIPAWVASSIHDRNDKMACSRPRQIPVVDIPLLNKLKRNRSTSSASVSQSPDPPSKKLRTGASPGVSSRLSTSVTATRVAPAGLTSVTSPSDSSPSAQRKPISVPEVITDPTRRLALQQKIESQLNLEILLKHDELRLIDTELAKCQIALEQLRRCEAIPFPVESHSPMSRVEVSSGIGSALLSQPGYSIPRQPAPWGVVDGPYSRHYAQWLLPDPEFDASPLHLLPNPATPHLDSRPTRGSASERRFAGKSRTTTTSTIGLQALATNYSTPKDKSGPLVIKRPADGQMVKLVCHQCNRENFSSVQGFLNHCRIAHGRNFESHGAAADSCGVPVDAGDSSSVPEMPAAINTMAAVNATATVSAAEPLVTTPQTGRPLVHPFITSVKSGREVSLPTASTLHASPVATRQTKSKASLEQAKPHKFSGDLTKGQFVPSTHTPRLSALVKKFGMSTDFNKIVDQAKEKIDLEQVSPLESDDEADAMDVEHFEASADSTVIAHTATKPSMGRARTSNSVARPTPLRTDLSHPKNASRTGSTSSVGTMEDEQTNYSPHTIETNPGLISDREDEDYEDHSSRTSEDDNWSEQDHHHVRVRQHHHKDDGQDTLRQILGHGDDVHDDMDVSHLDGTQSCARVIQSPLPATPATPPKRKRGRPSKKDAQARMK